MVIKSDESNVEELSAHRAHQGSILRCIALLYVKEIGSTNYCQFSRTKLSILARQFVSSRTRTPHPANPVFPQRSIFYRVHFVLPTTSCTTASGSTALISSYQPPLALPTFTNMQVTGNNASIIFNGPYNDVLGSQVNQYILQINFQAGE